MSIQNTSALLPINECYAYGNSCKHQTFNKNRDEIQIREIHVMDF